jgi:hypothetical protein
VAGGEFAAGALSGWASCRRRDHHAATGGYRFLVLGDEIRLSGAFGFTGEPTGRPHLPDEAATVHRYVGQVERTAPGLRLSSGVCGDKRFKSTVQGWVRCGAVA